MFRQAKYTQDRECTEGTRADHPGIGMRVSHGCIQLYPEDIARLFAEVPLGTKVTAVNQPYLVGSRAGELYLEAHTPQIRHDDKAAQDVETRDAAGKPAAFSEGDAAPIIHESTTTHRPHKP